MRRDGRLKGWSLAAMMLALCAPAFAGSPTVTTQFFNSVDIGGFGSCAWGQGTPAPNREVEESLRGQVESSLKAKGYTIVRESSECRVTSRAIREGNFPIGMVVIELREESTGALAWRGEATGLVNYGTKQLKKKARKVVKAMFKDFPKAR